MIIILYMRIIKVITYICEYILFNNLNKYLDYIIIFHILIIKYIIGSKYISYN